MMIRWTPFNEAARFEDGVARLFNGLLPTENVSPHTAWQPAVDLVEDAEKFSLYADLPGVSETDLDIQIENGVLTLRGSRKLGHEGTERVQGAFARSFKLPPLVDGEKVTASLKEGVLTVVVPKRPEALPQKIKVQVQ